MNRNKFDNVYKFYPGSHMGKNRLPMRNRLRLVATDHISSCTNKYRKRPQTISSLGNDKYCPKRFRRVPPFAGPPQVEDEIIELFYPPFMGPPILDENLD